MLGLCCKNTYGETTNDFEIDDHGYNKGNEDKNDDNNDDYGSGSNSQIFDLIATPRSRLCLAEEDRTPTTTTLRPHHHMYIRVEIYQTYK